MKGDHGPRGCAVALLIAPLLTFTPGVSWGDSSGVPTTRLSYTIDSGIEGCPDEAAMRGAVATHLGYDPFRDDGSWLVRAHIQRTKAELSARIEITDEMGAPFGGRTLRAPKGECADLVESMALATSLALDPVTNPRAPAAKPPAAPAPPIVPVAPAPPPVAVALVPTAPVAPTSVSEPPRRFAPYVVAATHGSIGGTPALALGFSVGVGAERGWGSLGLEARFDLSSDATSNVVGIEARRFGVLAVGCVSTRRVEHMLLSGCAVGGGGPTWSQGVDVTHDNPRVDAHIEVGARAHAAWLVSDLITIGLRAELLVALTRTELSVEVGDARELVWSSLPVTFTVGPDISARFR